MSIIVPITRREYVRRPSLVLVPLPAARALEPRFAQAAGGRGIDCTAVEWGRGIMLVAPLSAERGREVTVHARLEDLNAAGERRLTLFAPGSDVPVQDARFGTGEGAMSVGLTLRLHRTLVVAAVACHADGRLQGVIAEMRLI